MDDPTLSVSELSAIVRAALDAAMPYGVWVEGEISGLNRSRNGHVYFDLTEPSDTPGGAPIATMPVVLFRDSRDRVNRLLKRHGDPIRMSDGVRIRIQGMVDYYPPQGRIQFRMSAIDPTYTLGQMAADRDALLTALSADGLLRANARHAIPAVPLRVGVVTSLGSAAHADITTVFERSELAFTLVEVDTPVQGLGAERGVAAAIAAALGAGVDVIIVARGGGSKTDLATFDHEHVARAVAAAGVPVITGVGHDIDRSVADEVAHTATTTPTAAAQLVVACVAEWLGRLAECERDVVSGGRRAVERAGHRVELARRGVIRSGLGATERADARLAQSSQRLARSAQRVDQRARAQLDLAVARIDVARRHAFRRAGDRIDIIEARVTALDPAIALARGWSITRTDDGRVLRSVADLQPGATLTTRVADGTTTSTITDVDLDPSPHDPEHPE
ncbi:MAG: exodeoxyribonuclease VII large subunit [Acidimicrobiales bacterium]